MLVLARTASIDRHGQSRPVSQGPDSAVGDLGRRNQPIHSEDNAEVRSLSFRGRHAAEGQRPPGTPKTHQQ